MRMKSLRMAAAALRPVALAGLGLIAPTSAMALPSPIIDPTATVTLNIAKFLDNTTGQPNNGTQQTVSGTPLEGVDFDVSEFAAIDLTTNAGWAASIVLQDHTLTAGEIADGFVTVDDVNYPFTLVTTVTTDAGAWRRSRRPPALASTWSTRTSGRPPRPLTRRPSPPRHRSS